MRILSVDIPKLDGFPAAKFDILKSRWLPTLGQALELYDAYHAKVVECDLRIEAVLRRLPRGCGQTREGPVAAASSSRQNGQRAGLRCAGRIACGPRRRLA